MSTVTLKELREFKHRINPEERQGAYGYYFIRPLSLYVTYFALRLGLTANHITVLQTLSGVAGAVSLAFPAPLMRLLGVLLLQFGFVLDNVDGEVARFRKQVSVTGKFLDVVGHEIVIPFMFFGLGIGAYFQLGRFEAIIFGFLAGFFSLRFDMSAMYHEAAQLLETKLDQSYDYYANLPLEQSSALKIYRRKNEESAIRMLYALFAYPATMNIITVLIVLEIMFSPLPVGDFLISPTYVFLALYGVLLPIRRVLTIRRLVQGRETERKYVTLVEHLKVFRNR